MLTVTQMNSMSIADLLKLNKQVVAIVKEKQRMDNRTASFSFMPGDAVTYMSGKFGVRVTAKVVQVKRTKVVVEIGQGGRYLVPASMLAKVD
jgi:hypothetical protein